MNETTNKALTANGDSATEIDPARMYSAAEAARFLGLASRGGLACLRRRTGLVAYRRPIGRSYCYRGEDILQILNGRKPIPAPARVPYTGPKNKEYTNL